MAASVSDRTITQGMAKAVGTNGRTGRSLRRRINGYSYSALLPSPPTPDNESAAPQTTENATASTRQRWDSEFLPALERDLEYMRAVDLKSASDADLLERLDEFLEIQRRHWYFHFLVVFPVSAAAENMATLYREFMGAVPDGEPYELLQGIDNMTLETDRALRSLADEAREAPEVEGVIMSGLSPDKILPGLGSSDAGRRFIQSLERFLSVYGYRPTGFDYVYPSWIEDPSFVLLNIRSYLSSDPRDLDREQEGQAKHSKALLDRALKTLESDQSKRKKFLEAYDRARELWPLKEDHAFYIDQGSTAVLRILIVEMGGRLSRRGILRSQDDVFYMDLDELTAATSDPAPDDIQRFVDARRRERDRFMKVSPPPVLGTLPSDDSPLVQPELQRMFGPTVAPLPDGASTALRGVSGSRGTATGPARVVRGPDDFEKVRPGDVLVCTSTSPTWTPLFASVAALASDSGGVLSHTAIVAREYGLPAVVGVKYGTSVIRDGQIVTVDGDAGVVLLR
jgi:pyruvate,water dikinase